MIIKFDSSRVIKFKFDVVDGDDPPRVYIPVTVVDSPEIIEPYVCFACNSYGHIVMEDHLYFFRCSGIGMYGDVYVETISPDDCSTAIENLLNERVDIEHYAVMAMDIMQMHREHPIEINI